jgi:cytochrome c
MKALVLGVALLGLSAGVALADGDAAAGKKVFSKCAACHSVGEGAKAKTGPALNDVFGAVAGVGDYNFSAAMVKKGEEGLVWTPETFAEFIKGPKAYVPGTKMTFAGLKDDTQIADITAYLLTMSPNYVPGGAEAAPAESSAEEAPTAP